MNIPSAKCGTSRRSFMKFGAAALAGASTLKYSFPAFGADNELGGLKLGAQSYTFRDRSIDKCLEAMQEIGLKYVEFFSSHTAGLSPDQLKEKCDSHKIEAVSYGVIGFSGNHDSNRQTFEMAKKFGYSNLSCDPSPDSFDSLDKLTDEYKITCAIHPHGPGAQWSKVDQIWNAVKDHSKMIGLCNDTGHLIRAGEDPLKACEVFKGRMFAMHLKDFKKNGNNWEDVPASQGSLDVDGIVKFLLDNKYEHPVYIEYEGGGPVEASQKSVERVKEAVKKVK